MIGDDAYLRETNDGIEFIPSKDAFDERLKNPYPVLKRRIERGIEVKGLPLKAKLELLNSFHDSFSSFTKQRLSLPFLFRKCCLKYGCMNRVTNRITKEELCCLFEESRVEMIMGSLKNMIGNRMKLGVHLSLSELGCGLECYSSACSIVYAVFEYLGLKSDVVLLSRLSLVSLYACNGDNYPCFFQIQFQTTIKSINSV